MKILVIGGSGLVGSNCLSHFLEQSDVIAVGTYFSYATASTEYFDTLNIDNPKNFDIAGFDPDVIMHCGALTHVDKCESEVEESYDKTVRSTRNVIELCKTYSARMLYVSTDYVFDGKEGPYDEEASVNPISVYGMHKMEAERLVLNEVPASVVIRITNVYGDEERDKNFVTRIAKACIEGKELDLKLPVDQYATPVNAADVARALFLLANDGKSGIYNIASTDFFNRVELVEKIQTHFPGNKISFESVTTAELGQPAPRPLMGGLKTDKFMQAYPDFVFSTVDDYLNKFVSSYVD
ncbi:MAG: SDR family oxidoreductase [Flavobacteriales bacterium]|nr:SDR family oxidoreductase [Flavobacteriales bacterium]